MGYGVGFRVSPGVRLRATRRGPRVSLGPRIARVHVGGGRSAVSSGAGPFTVWSTLSGGGHATPTQPSPARKRKEQEWGDVRSHLDGLLGAHAEPVSRAQAPHVPAPAPPEPSVVRRELARQLADGARWWQLGRWLRAWREAQAGLDDELARRRERLAAEHRHGQREADRWWQAVLDNDPTVLADHLEQGLSEHQMPATVTAVEDATVHLALAVQSPEQLIGPREPTITDHGNLSLKRMTKTRRHELYEAAISSAVVASAAEVFARGPNVEQVDVAVLAPEHIGGPAVLMLAALPRDLVLPDGADRPASGDLVHAAEAGRATLVRDKGGRIGALRPLDRDDEDVAMLLDVLDA